MTADVIVLAGAMAQRPGRAGHAWVFVNWMLAFQRLGYRAVFLDRMDASMGSPEAGVSWVRSVMSVSGLQGCWSVRLGDESAGLDGATVSTLCADAMLVNVMGYLDDPELLAGFSRRIFLDIDPGFGQVWQANGQACLFDGHDAYATVGMNVGGDNCAVPDLGIRWIPTLPAVDTRSWATTREPAGAFTTVASWRGPFAPLEIHGTIHGLRAHQARAFACLPRRTGENLEMALDIDIADDRDRRLLLDGGWTLHHPSDVAGGLESYRRYVHDSLAEFAVAKQAYVALQTGWFSDRSACYLASGRAVVVSDTGLADHLPIGEGLLVFSDVSEAADAIAEVRSDPVRHGRVAREIAAAHFEGTVVARSLLDRAA